MKLGRPQTSPHGRLFGCDSLYEVLAELAAHRGEKFSILPVDRQGVIPLAELIGRTPTQTRNEVRKLQGVGVLAEVQRVRKSEVYAVTDDKLTEFVLSLPELLVERLGPHTR